MDSPRPSAIDPVSAVGMFTALSQPSRLAIFLQLLAAGPEGVATQGLAETLGTTGSALTLHLRALEGVGLIHVPARRRGQQTARVIARIDRFTELGAWMAEHGRGAGWGPEVSSAAAVRQVPSSPHR